VKRNTGNDVREGVTAECAVTAICDVTAQALSRLKTESARGFIESVAARSEQIRAPIRETSQTENTWPMAASQPRFKLTASALADARFSDGGRADTKPNGFEL
jgi:hypothetical protein